MQSDHLPMLAAPANGYGEGHGPDWYGREEHHEPTFGRGYKRGYSPQRGAMKRCERREMRRHERDLVKWEIEQAALEAEQELVELDAFLTEFYDSYYANPLENDDEWLLWNGTGMDDDYWIGYDDYWNDYHDEWNRVWREHRFPHTWHPTYEWED